MHSWQNGTRCRDSVKFLWCRSHLVRPVFEGSIPTCACFHSETFFVPAGGFLNCFLEIVREKRGGKGRRQKDAWSLKYESIELCCSQRTKNHTFKCFQVKL